MWTTVPSADSLQGIIIIVVCLVVRLDTAFQKGLLAFSNYYNSQLRGLEWLESEINSDIEKEVNNVKASGVFDDDELIKKLFSRIESGQKNFFDNYKCLILFTEDFPIPCLS